MCEKHKKMTRTDMILFKCGQNSPVVKSCHPLEYKHQPPPADFFQVLELISIYKNQHLGAKKLV